MLNAIKSEFFKIKKNCIFYVCSALVILAISWVVCNKMISSNPVGDFKSWVQIASLVSSLFFSIASGFVLTFLIQHEYEHKTIINVLTAPISRVTFIISKLVIWFVWYILVLAICIFILFMGGKLLFAANFGINEIQILLSTVAKTRILGFVSTTPLLLIAILQKHTFYPTVMCAIAFAGMELLSLVLPIKYSCMIPWSAVILVGSEIPEIYMVRAIVVIFLTGILGVWSACFAFKRQNQ